MRKTFAWIIFFVFALWGPLEAFPCAFAPAAASLPQTTFSPQTVAAPPAHSPNCHCMQCDGGAKCCCRPTKNPAKSALLMARCDRPIEKSLTGKTKPPIALWSLSVPLPAASVALHCPASHDALRLRFVVPPTPPPCQT